MATNVDSSFQRPIPTEFSKAGVESFAEEIAKIFNYEDGGSLEKLVSDLGGTISYELLDGTHGNDGSIKARDINDFEVKLSPFTHPIRDRFTLAHELGHLFLHLPILKKKHGQKVGMIPSRYTHVEMGEDERRAEWEANWFAAAFLMPAERFREVYKLLGKDLTSTFFYVSPRSAEVRAKTLGL